MHPEVESRESETHEVTTRILYTIINLREGKISPLEVSVLEHQEGISTRLRQPKEEKIDELSLLHLGLTEITYRDHCKIHGELQSKWKKKDNLSIKKLISG